MYYLIYFGGLIAGGVSLSLSFTFLRGYAVNHKVLDGHLSSRPDFAVDTLMFALGIILGIVAAFFITFADITWLNWLGIPLIAVAAPTLTWTVVFAVFYGGKGLVLLCRNLWNKARACGQSVRRLTR